MTFIELHHNGRPRLINVSRISTIWSEDNDAWIWMVGEPDSLFVDESYNEIKAKLQEAGFIWNV